MFDADLRILIIDETAVRASILEDGLREAGYLRITIVTVTHELLRRIVEADPDVIFIDLENPNRDVLEQMFQVSRSVRRPIVLGASDQAAITRLAASQGRVHPVFGLWPLALTPALESWLVGGGSRKVHDWLQDVPHVVVEFDEVDGRDPFFNVNTPDDASVARSLLPETAFDLVSPLQCDRAI